MLTITHIYAHNHTQTHTHIHTHSLAHRQQYIDNENRKRERKRKFDNLHELAVVLELVMTILLINKVSQDFSSYFSLVIFCVQRRILFELFSLSSPRMGAIGRHSIWFLPSFPYIIPSFATLLSSKLKFRVCCFDSIREIRRCHRRRCIPRRRHCLCNTRQQNIFRQKCRSI